PATCRRAAPRRPIPSPHCARNSNNRSWYDLSREASMTGRCRIVALASVALAIGPALAAQGRRAGGLTDVAGIKVGHHTLTTRPTGCTVVIVERGAVAGVDVRGAAPGTR